MRILARGRVIGMDQFPGFDCPREPPPEKLNILLCLIDGADRRRKFQVKLNNETPTPLRVTVMSNRSANYRGYAIEGAMNGQGWSVEVHPRSADFPILRKGTFRVGHPSWILPWPRPPHEWTPSSMASRTRNPNLPTALQEVFDAAWSIVASTSRVRKSGANVQTQLRLALGRCIVALAANGVTDPTDLKRQAVERIVLGEEAASSGSSLVAQ